MIYFHWHKYDGVNGIVEEALVSLETYMETNAISWAQFWPKLFLKAQAPKHRVGLGLIDCFEYFLEQQ